MASRMNFPKRIDNRRAEAKLRNEERAKRGDAGQLARLISKWYQRLWSIAQSIHDREHTSYHRIEDDMQDWIEKRLSSEWVVYYLKSDTETYLFEHRCGGAVAYTDQSKVCSQCKAPVPGKFIMVVQMTLKKDLLRV